MSLIAIFSNPQNPNRWRPGEREALEYQFGGIMEPTTVSPSAPNDSTILWRFDAEKTPFQQAQMGMWLSGELDGTQLRGLGTKQLNRPTSWPAVHAKDVAFRCWERAGLPVPKWATFPTGASYNEAIKAVLIAGINFPYLLRINDGNTGEWSYLVTTTGISEEKILWNLWATDLPAANQKYGPCPLRCGIAVQFINALRNGLRYSYRVIVAGNEVITAYARVCPPEKWVAITSEFKTEYGPAWLDLQEECELWCQQNRKLLVEAMRAVDLDWAGIDVIFDADRRPYLLEVQTDYSCGNPRYGDIGPWYNPSYPELVKFLKNNAAEVERRSPRYWHLWLNKAAHFKVCAGSLAAYLKLPVKI